MSGSSATLERLAADHDRHLAFLRARLGTRFAPDELEDVLQAAYARALTSLTAAGDRRPVFADDDARRAWLRTIALNVAADEERRRHGRRPSERAQRPRQVPLETPDGPLPILDGDVCVEEEALAAVERADLQAVVLRALESLAPEHRQVLKLRYGDNLDPPAIMVLERINRRQWEGRHTRAVKAFARALGRMRLSSHCDQTRRLLRRRPEALLMGAMGDARDHVAACPACSAFARSCRGAAAVMPLPLLIDPWRYELLEYLAAPARGSSTPRRAGATPPATATSGSAWSKTLAILSCSVAVAAGVVGVSRDSASAPASRHAPTLTAPAADAGRTRWAPHETERAALERAARDLARSRASAASSGSARP